MDALALLAALSVMATVILAMIAFYSGSVSPRAAAQARLGSAVGGSSIIEEGVSNAPLREDQFGGILPILTSLLAGKEWARDVAQELDQADVNLRVGEYVATRFVLALLLFVSGLVAIGVDVAGLLVGIVLAVVGYMLPRFFVGRRRKKRLEKLNGQLEETLTMVANSMKAGFGLLQSLELAANQMSHPISTELRRLLHDINVGANTEQALVDLSERVGSYELDLVVTAILIQRTVGGNLSEILETVAHTMRERSRIKGDIQTMTGQQRMTGYVLVGLPVGIAGILLVIAPDYMGPMFSTTAGLVMLVGAGIWELIGILLMRRILAIDI
jgi:tight adherence protein B